MWGHRKELASRDLISWVALKNIEYLCAAAAILLLSSHSRSLCDYYFHLAITLKYVCGKILHLRPGDNCAASNSLMQSQPVQIP